ncbi:MAG: glutathione S-transferase N-terminal domain-containing protein [Candidatus Bathyarchaeia archaeon]
MSEEVILYVKSEKIERVEYTMPNWGHWCSAGYRVTKTDFALTEEDRKAIELLERSGLPFKVVDLSLAGAPARLKAKIARINTTPTLVFKGQKFKGLMEFGAILEKEIKVQK